MAFPAAPTESGSAKIHFLTSDGNAAAGWVAIETGSTGTGSNTVGWAGIATHVEGDEVADPGDITTSGVPLVLMGGDDSSTGTVGPLQLDANDALKVVLQAGTASYGALSAGTAEIGNVKNSGTFVTQIDGDALTALQLIDDIVVVEDAVHNTGASGVMALSVRNDSLAALAGTDGDYAPLQVNGSGALYIQEGAALDVSGATVTVDLAGNNDVTIDGSSIVLAEDTTHSSGAAGVMALSVRNDALAALAGTDGDYAPLQVNASGALYIQEGAAMDVSAATVTVDGSGVTQPVSGTVTANLSATDNAVLDTIDAVLDTINAKLVSGTTIGAVEIADTSFAVADGNALGEGILIQGDDGTDRKNINVDATTGDVQVDVTNTVTVTESAPLAHVFGGGTEAAAQRVTIATDSTGVLTVDGTVTANLSATDNAVLDTIDAVLDAINAKLVTGTVIGDVNLGATDNAVLDSIDTAVNGTLTVGSHAVTNAGTFVVQEDGAALTALQLIDDAVYVDDADWTDGASKHLLVGGLYQSAPQTVTDGDVAPFNIDANGALHVSDGGGAISIDDGGNTITVDGNVGDNGPGFTPVYAYTQKTTTAAETLHNPTAARFYLTDIIISIGSTATVVTLAYGATTAMTDTILVFNGDVNGGMTHTFRSPIKSDTDAFNLNCTLSGANTVDITLCGYEAAT
jgi:hypothetical protein